MACTSLCLSAGTSQASAKDILRNHNHNGLSRSDSGNDLRCDQTRILRSKSEPLLRCSLDPSRASPTDPKVKSSRSIGVFPLQIETYVLDSEETEDMRPDEEVRVLEEDEEMGVENRANWVERLLELKDHWRDRRPKEADGEEEGYCSVRYDDDEEGGGERSGGEAAEFDGETFSEFLVGVPWSVTRLLSQLAFLCNMAYTIPKLTEEDLRRYYGLHLVTSSLERKLEVAAMKAKYDGDSTRPPVKSDSKERSESAQKRPIRPSVAYEIAASAASYVHSRAKGLFSLGESHHPVGNVSYVADAASEPCRAEEEIPGRVYKSEVAAYMAASTMTAVVAAEEIARQEAARDLRSLHSSPCDWFVCDDPNTCTRFFVIQGSDSLSSWQANLFFEPTKFEGTEAFVHRGIYEAAKGIYKQFIPEIQSHLKEYGKRARFRFTGHSLGGSLSLLVSLMLLARGVVEPSTLLPVVSFGSPFVFCDGRSVLDELGLDEGHVFSVMMHRDIVPRAFSCTYPNHVAQVLKRLNGAFRSHPCLNNDKVLYSPLGQLLIVQPDERYSPSHPFLPPGGAVYAFNKGDGGTTNKAGAMTALKAFLNSPHPLETLSDLTAYGSEGTILRDHESTNYLKAINGVMRTHNKQVVRRSREQRLQYWWPLLTGILPTDQWNRHGRSPDDPGLLLKEVVSGVGVSRT